MRGLLVLSLAVVASTVAAQTYSKSCVGKNAFLKDLSITTPQVKILEDVKFPEVGKPFAHCSHEWNIHGTCCESRSLVDLYNYESKIIDNNKKLLFDGLDKVKLLINKLFKNAFQKETLNRIKKLKSTNDVCWNYMKKLRASALCSICSGRSQFYFTADTKKILVDPRTCKQAVDSCKGFFEAYIWIKSNVRKITSSFGPIVKTFFRDSIIKKVEDAILNSSPPKPLMTAFQEYLNNKGKSDLNSAKVCSIFLNVRYRPVYFDLNALVSNPSVLLGNATHSNYETRSLGDLSLVSSDSSLGSLLSSDSSVLLSKTDSMYTTSFGAAGTTQYEGSTTMMPVNTSLVFP